MFLLLVAVAILIADQATKYVMLSTFSPGETVPLWKGVFHLTLVENPGAAFGILPFKQAFFIVVTVVVIGAIIYYYRRMPREKNLLRLALSLEVGGALGNLVDRVRFGHVVDFFDFRLINWPVFNIADCAIVIGAVLLVWEIVVRQSLSKMEKKETVETQVSEGRKNG